MNYTNIYDSLIKRAIERDAIEKFEKHHIVPRSLGGSNKKSNLVKLSLREHFIAHLLLAKIHGHGMWFALYMMSNFKKYNSKQYAKTRSNLKHSPESRKRMSESAKNRICTPEGRLKRSILFKGRKHSEETINKIRESQLGRTFTDDHKQKLKSSHKGMTGKTFSNESKRKMSESQRNQPEVVCPHCHKAGKGSAMMRWHFDNCSSFVLL